MTSEALRRVVIADPDIDRGRAQALLSGLGVTTSFTQNGWAQADVVAVIVSPEQRVGERELAICRGLELVITTSTGYDNIDLDACQTRGIKVWHPRDYCSDEVADSTLALLVALLRGTVLLDRAVRAGRWHFAAAGELHRLEQTRLGIVGFGRIGRKVAARARALEMTVAAYDPQQPASVFEACGVRSLGLRELFQSSTAITVHVPLTPATRGLVSNELLSLLPRGAILVNAARGGIVDLAALLAQLDSGRLSAAALDVLEVEPPTAQAPAPQHPRLVVTPHAAWYSERSAHTLFITPLEVVRDHLSGHERSDYETGEDPTGRQ